MGTTKGVGTPKGGPDSDILATKAESVTRCLERIEAHLPASVAELESDYDAQDIISLNLQRAVQLCVDMASYIVAEKGWGSPATMAESFQALAEHKLIEADLADRLKRAVGFRNVSVHEYDRIDWVLVYEVITTRLDDFRSFISGVYRGTETE